MFKISLLKISVERENYKIPCKKSSVACHSQWSRATVKLFIAVISVAMSAELPEAPMAVCPYTKWLHNSGFFFVVLMSIFHPFLEALLILTARSLADAPAAACFSFHPFLVRNHMDNIGKQHKTVWRAWVWIWLHHLKLHLLGKVALSF